MVDKALADLQLVTPETTAPEDEQNQSSSSSTDSPAAQNRRSKSNPAQTGSATSDFSGASSPTSNGKRSHKKKDALVVEPPPADKPIPPDNELFESLTAAWVLAGQGAASRKKPVLAAYWGAPIMVTNEDGSMAKDAKGFPIIDTSQAAQNATTLLTFAKTNKYALRLVLLIHALMSGGDAAMLALGSVVAFGVDIDRVPIDSMATAMTGVLSVIPAAVIEEAKRKDAEAQTAAETLTPPSAGN